MIARSNPTSGLPLKFQEILVVALEILTKLHRHGHAHENLPIHQHMRHPNKSGNQALKKLLPHPDLLCQNCIVKESQ